MLKPRVRLRRCGSTVQAPYSTARDPDYCNAFVSRSPTSIASSGSMSGIRLAVKDLFCTSDLPTTCSSKMLSKFQAGYDATPVKLLRQCGVRVVGKTNMDEFGMGSHNSYSYFGTCLNPFRFDPKNPRSPGGSSGGSAAAVGSGLADLALASDTGGSTRLPASWCGLLGLKPSYGLISRFGMIQYATSLDTVGLISHKTDIVKKAFDVINKFDEKDPTSMPNDIRSKSQDLHSSRSSIPLSTLRIGIASELFPESVSSDTLQVIRKALTYLKRELGCTLVPVSVSTTGREALGAYYVLASGEASSCLAKFDGARYGYKAEVDRVSNEVDDDRPFPIQLYAATRTEAFGEEVKRRLLLGTYSLSAEAFDNFFLQAQRLRLSIQQSFNSIFSIPSPLTLTTRPINIRGVDVLICPSSIGTAPLLTDIKREPREKAWDQDRLLVPASLAGLPSISVPVGVTEQDGGGWPVGLQVIGQWGGEELLLRVAEALEPLNVDA